MTRKCYHEPTIFIGWQNIDNIRRQTNYNSIVDVLKSPIIPMTTSPPIQFLIRKQKVPTDVSKISV